MAPPGQDDDNEGQDFRTPLPQDDRLWRHPSEIDEPSERDLDARRSLWAQLRRLAEG